MYQRNLPTDAQALEQLARDRLAKEARSPSAPHGNGESTKVLVANMMLRLQVEELTRANELLATALNGTPDAIFIKDAAGKYLLMNDPAAAFVGRPTEEILGLDDRELFDAPGAEHDMACDRAIVATGGTIIEEKELTSAGVQRTFWSKKSPLRDAEGNIMGVVGSARDITAMKRAEQQLRENEARLAEAQEIGGLGSFEIELPDYIGRCSPALCRIFGFENDEPFRDVRAFFQKYRHPADHTFSEQTRAKLLASGDRDDIEHRYLHPDGRERVLHIRRRVIRDVHRQPVKLVGTVQDITEQRRAELELRASEARYRFFVDHVTDAMFLHGAGGVILDVNQPACDSLSYTRDELIGQTPAIFDPSATPERMQHILRVRKQGNLVSFESQHRRRDGTTFPVEVRIRFFEANGEEFGISLVQNIEHRLANDEAVRESERRFRELADAIPQIVWLAGPDGGLWHLNARAVEYTGVHLTDLTGWSWENVIHPDDIAATVRDWTKILQTGIPQPLEFRIRRADGEYRWHMTRQVASRDESGNITQWYGTCTDIEDHKRAEEALRASEDRYRRLFNSIPDPMFVFDQATTQFLAVNDAAVERYGYSREELLGLCLLDIQPAEDREAPAKRSSNKNSTFEDRGIERHKKKNHEIIEVDVTTDSLELEGKPATIALARDVTARRQAEAEARRTGELLRVVAEGTPDAVFVKDREGKYLLFNPAAAEFVGKPVADVLGKDDTALFSHEEATAVMAVDRRVMETQVAETNEERLTAAGVTRWYLAMKAPYRDEYGNVVGTIGISRDITERKRAEEQIRESQQRLQALFNNALNAILLVSDDAFVDVNPAACVMLGYSREELLAMSMQAISVADSALPSSEDRWNSFRQQGYQRGSVQLRRKDGEIIIAEFSAVANVLPGIHLSILSDVTERNRAEEAFRKVSAIHESIIHTAAEGIGLCAPTSDEEELQFAVWNDQMTSLTGYTCEEVNNAGLIELLFEDPRVREQARNQLKQLIAGKSLHGEEWEITRKDGERRLMSVSTSLIVLDRRAPSFVVMIQDITQRRRDAEELALRQAELRHVARLTTVGQMVAALSHEVAQPLAAISNYAASSTALLNAKDASQLDVVRKHIEQITQQSRRAAAIIHRLRDFSRKGSPRQSRCDLHELLRSSVEMVSLELRRGAVQVVFALEDESIGVSADPIQLQQVFVNLLLNARDALLDVEDRPRIIAIRTFVATKVATVEIEDNGPGVTDDVAARLFEPFVTTKDQGVGIGLSICRAILHDHGGEIEYHPLKQGGTSFCIRLGLSSSQIS